MPRSKGIVIGFWIVTALFCLQMGFTAYAQLRLPQVAEAFTHLGFPAYFRVELSWAKLLGVALLLAPVPARLKEWAYAGFAIDLGSALIAHLSVGDGPEAWGWAAATGALWGLSYFLWLRLQATPAGLGVAEQEGSDLEDGLPMTSRERATGKPASRLIDQRIRDLGGWRGETLARMRALILEADPEMTEEWKWMGTPVWSHHGIVCTGEAYTKVVKLTFARGASIPDPSRLFNSSLEGNTRRAIDIHEGEKVDAGAFKALVKAAVAQNSPPAKKR